MAEIQRRLERLGWLVTHHSGGRVEYELPKARLHAPLVIDMDRARVSGGVWAALNADKMRAIGFCDPRRDDPLKPRAESFHRVWISLDAWSAVTANALIQAYWEGREVDRMTRAEFLAGDREAGRAVAMAEEEEFERREVTRRTGWHL